MCKMYNIHSTAVITSRKHVSSTLRKHLLLLSEAIVAHLTLYNTLMRAMLVLHCNRLVRKPVSTTDFNDLMLGT
jgi:hypothetical protein